MKGKITKYYFYQTLSIYCMRERERARACVWQKYNVYVCKREKGGEREREREGKRERERERERERVRMRERDRGQL